MNKVTQNFDTFPIRKVLVVDDEEGVRMLIIKILERAGFSCGDAENGENALALLDIEDFDLVISDIDMPGMDGIELLKKIKAGYPEIDVIIMTGYSANYSYVEIMDAGASDYMSKPFNIDATLARIKRIAREKKNILDLKQINKELSIATDRANILAVKASEASKAKTFFLASMSHEIRTPLNGIVGYTDMLIDTPLDDEQKSFLKNARFSCDTLLSVVNDILDFSKVEAGKLTLEKIVFDPEVLCFETIDMIRTRVDESQVELHCSIADNVPEKLIGDPHRFRQVLLNLLGNAVKFTHQGAIKLFVESQTKDENYSILTIRVQDTGIGIAQNEQQTIFKSFIQSEKDIANKYTGTGLGLAISKNIAENMGGDIWVKSEEDRGSTFYFTSCFKISDNKIKKRIRPVALKNKNILLVTTSEEASEILFHELKLAQMMITKIDLADFEIFSDKDAEQHYDIAIIDFGKTVKAG
ncbi:response regulator, partial [Desulfobacterales bacterium HSG17]|nr:response regulator [Desulfobacterales bacterium HSG17]